MRFFNKKLVIFSRNGAHVQWLIEPEDTDISTIEVEILRSEAPTGPFKSITTLDPLLDFAYTDKTVPWRPQNQDVSYKLRAVEKSTGDTVHESAAFGLEGPLTLDALEIIRQHKILLEGLNGHRSLRGIECTLYKKRNFGPRCHLCVDALTNRVTVSNCQSCSGTGFVIGYYEPVNIHVNIEPYPTEIRLANVGKIEPSDTQIFMTNFPVMYPGDLVVEPDEKHWRVKGTHYTERNRNLVHQVLGVTQLKPDDIAHETLLHSSHR
jgi:hypothetical protein